MNLAEMYFVVLFLLNQCIIGPSVKVAKIEKFRPTSSEHQNGGQKGDEISLA